MAASLSMQKLRILLIDDNEIDVRIVQKLLETGHDEPYELLVSRALSAGKARLQKDFISVVLLDLHLPDSNVEQTMQFVEEFEEQFPFIILSSIDEKQLRIRAIQKGAQDFLIKNDFDAALLMRVLNYSIERHRLHKELHEQTKELRDKEQRLIESQAIAQIGNWELLDSNTIEWSAEARKILELDGSAGFTTFDWFLNLIEYDNRLQTRDLFQQAIEHNRDFNVDLKVRFPNRKTKYINLRVRSTKADEEGSKIVRGTVQDITRRKQMEAALIASEEKYHRLFEESSNAIFITTEEGAFVDFNPAMVALFGYAQDELRQIEVSRLYQNPFERETIKKVIAQEGIIRDHEIKLRKKDGAKIDCLLTSSPWRSNDGKLRGYQGIIQDVTEKKRTDELIRKQEIAERSSRLKQRFLANMSHEIRTPITAIAGLTHLFEKTSLTPQQTEYLLGIRTSSEHLLALVNDILDFSKIEEGKIKFNSIGFNLREHLVQLIKTMEFGAQSKGIELIFKYDNEIPAEVAGDPVRLNQIIFNLLSNAIKFTDRGHVKLTTKLIEDAKNAVVISFAVEDTGIGIPEDKLETIFRSFTQLGKDITKTAEGTGLGLTITKQLVELQGGSISVKSKIDTGSTFEVVIMFKKQPDQEQREAVFSKKPTVAHVDIGYKKILIVDDKKLNQLVTGEILKTRWKKIEIEMADNGEIAIEKIKHRKFDLVLMDVQMPVMDGYEASQYIRKELQLDENALPILAMTAYTTSNEIEQCLKSGMNDFVAKPFEPEQLYQKIGELLNVDSQISFVKEPIAMQKQETDKLDLSYLNNISGGNEQLKNKIIEMLIEETPDEIYKLNEFARSKNWKRLRGVAHKMKSGISYLGLSKTLENVKKIEEFAGNEIHLDQIPDLVELVSITCTKAITDLVMMRVKPGEVKN